MEENKKYVYLFQEGNAKMKDILGGKGANLADFCGRNDKFGLTNSTRFYNICRML